MPSNVQLFESLQIVHIRQWGIARCYLCSDYMYLSRSNNIYHLLGINQCNSKVTEGRTTNQDLLSNEPKIMYWFTIDLSHIQHQLTKTIDVQPISESCLHNKSISFLSVDLKWLNDMMRNKNFEDLCQSGVKALAVVLGTYIKQVISGNVVDLIHWKNFFYAKKYQREPAKGLLSYVFKAFKATTVIVLLACVGLCYNLSAFGIKQHTIIIVGVLSLLLFGLLLFLLTSSNPGNLKSSP